MLVKSSVVRWIYRSNTYETEDMNNTQLADLAGQVIEALNDNLDVVRAILDETSRDIGFLRDRIDELGR